MTPQEAHETARRILDGFASTPRVVTLRLTLRVLCDEVERLTRAIVDLQDRLEDEARGKRRAEKDLACLRETRGSQ